MKLQTVTPAPWANFDHG